MTVSTPPLSAALGPDLRAGQERPKLDPAKAEELKQSARDFETAFLAETLSHMGFDGTSGVAGATEFSSILNRAYAEQLTDRGGLGLSADIFEALAVREQGK